MKFCSKILLLICIETALLGCASGVKKYGNLEHAVSIEQPLKVNKSIVTLSPEAQDKLADNPKFNVEDFQKTLNQTLHAGGYLQEDETNILRIVITDMRTRSNFSAVMFGMLAGSDSIDGKVQVINDNNETIRAFEVSADYALGGSAGGISDVRMSWLYEEFSELTLQQLEGEEE